MSTAPWYGSRSDPDPRYAMCGPMNPALWKGRHQGDNGDYAAEVARRIGGDCIVVQHGEFSWGVYQPRFEPVKVELSEGDTITLTPENVASTWHIAMRRTGEGIDHEEHPIMLTRGDLATLMSTMLPEAAALLDSVTAGRARIHGNTRSMGSYVGNADNS